MDDDEDKKEGCGSFVFGCSIVIVVAIVCFGLASLMGLGIVWSFVEVTAFLSEYGERIFIFVMLTFGIVMIIKTVVDWFR